MSKSQTQEANRALSAIRSAHDLSRCSTNAARKLIERNTAEELSVLPLSIHSVGGDSTLLVASATHSADLERKLKFIVGMELRIYVVNESILKKAIFNAYCGDEARLSGLIQAIPAQEQTRTKKEIIPFRIDAPVSDFLASLLEYCVAHHATDLHLIPEKDEAFARLRLQGRTLTDPARLCSISFYEKAVQRLKVLASLDITIKNHPLEGQLLIPTPSGEVFARISIVPTVRGEKVVIRFAGHTGIQTLEDLKMPLQVKDLIAQSIQTSGLLLCCGATGSGKTTTLYAAMELLSKLNKTLVSIEDPVERIVPWMCQIQVDGQKLTYEQAFKASLRQDPDAVMIGEIRDSKVAEEALKAALSGHIVLSSLHAPNASGAISRLISLGLNRSLLDQGVRLIVTQRLAPTLCEGCKVFDLQSTHLYGAKVCKAVGCGRCNGTGNGGVCVICDCLFRSGAKSHAYSFLESLNWHLCEGNISFSQYELLKEHVSDEQSPVSPKCVYDHF